MTPPNGPLLNVQPWSRSRSRAASAACGRSCPSTVTVAGGSAGAHVGATLGDSRDWPVIDQLTGPVLTTPLISLAKRLAARGRRPITGRLIVRRSVARRSATPVTGAWPLANSRQSSTLGIGGFFVLYSGRSDVRPGSLPGAAGQDQPVAQRPAQRASTAGLDRDRSVGDTARQLGARQR